MKIASIDIGTNAIKSKIFKTTPSSIEFLEGIRSPIRLGREVFEDGKLSKVKLDKLIETIQEYENIFKKIKLIDTKLLQHQLFETLQILKMLEDMLRRLSITLSR